MSFHKRQLRSRYVHSLPPETLETQSESAPTSAINAIMGKLGLAREIDEPETGVSDLARDLTDPAWVVRIEAVQKLGKMGKEAPLELLLVALRDEQSSVRIAATRALSRNPRQAAISALVSALDDPEWMVRVEAARALGSLPEFAPLEPLLLAAHDKNSAVRAAAVWALGELGTEGALESLKAALEDEDWSVREAAAFALGQLGKQSSIPSLLNARFDRDASVRTAAEKSLQQLYPGFLSALPPRSDSFEQWLERTNYPTKTDYPSKQEQSRANKAQRSGAAHKSTRQHAKSSPGTQVRASVSGWQKKLLQRPALVHWPAKFEELAGGLLAAFILTCLLASWFIVATWPRTSSPGQHHLAAFTAYRGHKSRVSKLAWSPDGLSIASADISGTVLIWQSSTGQKLLSYTQSGKVLALTWENSTTVLAVYAKSDRALQVYTLNIGSGMRVALRFQETNLPGVPEAAAWSPLGSILAFDTGNTSIQIWDLTTTNRRIATIQSDQPIWYSQLIWSPGGKQLATISTDGYLQIWNPQTGQDIVNLTSTQQVSIATWVVYDKLGLCMLFINSNGDMVRWTPASGSNAFYSLMPEQTYNLKNTSNLVVEALTISPNGEQLTMATSDGLVQARDSTTMNLVDVYTGHTAQVNDVEWSPSGNYLASASADKTVQVWQEPGA